MFRSEMLYTEVPCQLCVHLLANLCNGLFLVTLIVIAYSHLTPEICALDRGLAASYYTQRRRATSVSICWLIYIRGCFWFHPQSLL